MVDWPAVEKEDLARPLSVPGVALAPELLLQVPLVVAFCVVPGAGDGADGSGDFTVWGLLLLHPEVELPGLAGVVDVDGLDDELLQPELLLLEDDEKDLLPLEEDDLFAWAVWPSTVRARINTRKRTRHAPRFMPWSP